MLCKDITEKVESGLVQQEYLDKLGFTEERKRTALYLLKETAETAHKAAQMVDPKKFIIKWYFGHFLFLIQDIVDYIKFFFQSLREEI